MRHIPTTFEYDLEHGCCAVPAANTHEKGYYSGFQTLAHIRKTKGAAKRVNQGSEGGHVDRQA